MLPLYFNYLSTVTLREFCKYTIHSVASQRLMPEDMQYNSTVSGHDDALETTRQDASGGQALRGDQGVSGSAELGSLPPPPQPSLDQNRHTVLPISLSGCPREEDHMDGKIKGGQVKVTLLSRKKQKEKKRLNSRLLYLFSVEINKVLSLQNCWFGDLDDAGWGGVGWGWAESRPRPGRAPRGCPAAVQGPAPVQSRASFALPARAPARQRSSGPRPRSTARAAAVVRRAETTKDGPWVTPPQGSGRGPPTEATEHRGRAGRAPAGGAGRGRALLARRAQTGPET